MMMNALAKVKNEYMNIYVQSYWKLFMNDYFFQILNKIWMIAFVLIMNGYV